MQARIHPADPKTLPPDVTAAVHLNGAFDIYYARDLTQPAAVRRTYVEAAVTAGLQKILSTTTRRPDTT